MFYNLRLPAVNSPTLPGQVSQLKNYIYQLVEQLNYVLSQLPSAEQITAEKDEDGDGLPHVAGHAVVNIFNFAHGCVVGMTPFYTNETTTTANLPSSAYANSPGLVIKASNDRVTVLLWNPSNGDMAVQCFNGSQWLSSWHINQ